MTLRRAAAWALAITLLLGGRADAAPPEGDTVLVLGPKLAAANEVVSGLVDELGDRFTILRREVTAEANATLVAHLLDEVRPRVVVLLNNPTVRLYHDYQTSRPPGSSFPPAVILLTAFMEQSTAGLQNVTGIRYEVPAVTALVNMRSVLGKRLDRVGVLYRRGFAAFVARQGQVAAAEGFHFVHRVLEEGNRRDAVKRGLRQLLDYEHVDALWVLNDSALLNPELIARAWLPVLRHAHVPVLVGVSSLVSPKLPFGTFAVIPDHRALGAQAAVLIENLADNGWRLEAHPPPSPIAVEKILHLGLARAIVPVRDEKLREVDRVVDQPVGSSR